VDHLSFHLPVHISSSHLTYPIPVLSSLISCPFICAVVLFSHLSYLLYSLVLVLVPLLFPIPLSSPRNTHRIFHQTKPTKPCTYRTCTIHTEYQLCRADAYSIIILILIPVQRSGTSLFRPRPYYPRSRHTNCPCTNPNVSSSHLH